MWSSLGRGEDGGVDRLSAGASAARAALSGSCRPVRGCGRPGRQDGSIGSVLEGGSRPVASAGRIDLRRRGRSSRRAAEAYPRRVIGCAPCRRAGRRSRRSVVFEQPVRQPCHGQVSSGRPRELAATNQAGRPSIPCPMHSTMTGASMASPVCGPVMRSRRWAAPVLLAGGIAVAAVFSLRGRPTNRTRQTTSPNLPMAIASLQQQGRGNWLWGRGCAPPRRGRSFQDWPLPCAPSPDAPPASVPTAPEQLRAVLQRIHPSGPEVLRHPLLTACKAARSPAWQTADDLAAPPPPTTPPGPTTR